MTPKIRVAISGGGLAGATLLHALLPHKHLDVHIFESAAAFKEAGQAVGIFRNALSSLDLIGPGAMQCLDRAGAVLQNNTHIIVAEGPDQGKLSYELKGEGTDKNRLAKIVSRAAFLKELLESVPEDRMHASKKLDKVDKQGDGSLNLSFADGTKHECDILIGADGIRSVVRKIVLGEIDPATSPRNTGWWAIWTLQPYEKARSLLGEERVNIENPRAHVWVGDGTFTMHNVLSNGELVQFVVTAHDQKEVDGQSWQRTVSAETLRGLYQGSMPHLQTAVEQLLCQKPEQPAIYLWDHPHAKTYVSGPICVMGDAAHATTPWLSSGGGMAIEDSLILSTLLGRAETPSQAVTALEAYDEIRRPRTQRIVEYSRINGWILTGQDKEAGLIAEGIAQTSEAHGFIDFIHNFDMEKHRDDAIQMMARKMGAESS